MGLGIRGMLEDLGGESADMKVNIRTDASAAKGIAHREGLGKVRHLEVAQLWLQEKEAARGGRTRTPARRGPGEARGGAGVGRGPPEEEAARMADLRAFAIR